MADPFLESKELKQYGNVSEVLLKSRIIGQNCIKIVQSFFFVQLYAMLGDSHNSEWTLRFSVVTSWSGS